MKSSDTDRQRNAIPPNHRYARTHALLLTETVAAASQNSISSNRITFPFMIDSANFYFPPGCDNLVRLYLILSADPSVSASAIPIGTPILSFLSPNAFLIGDNISYPVDIDLPVLTRGHYLKLHIVNGDGFPHTPSALLTISELTETP